MEKRYSLKFVLTLVFTASALTCVLTLLAIGTQISTFLRGTNPVREYSALLSRIDEFYIGEYDESEVSAAAMRAAVYALGDRWSFYLSPEEYSEFLDDSNNRFSGIGVGVIIDEETGGMFVQSVYRGSGAEAAGLAVGDIIIGIDGGDIAGLDLRDMRILLARPFGDKVELTVLRENGSLEYVTVVYDAVFVDPVSYEMLESDIGYIALSNFDYGAAKSFITAIEDLTADGARAFIFDVRANPGGRVTEMTAILDYLLPEGEIFVAVDRRGREIVTMSDADCVDFSCIVLVDRNSYSAGEYFAALLREYNMAEIVGEQTTGKNHIQSTLSLPGGGALHISTGLYLTKNRISLTDVGGVSPDYPITLTDEEFALFMSGKLEKALDPQLSKAVSLLQY